MNVLKINEIHPFVRRVGIAVGIKQSSAMKAYDHRLIFFCDGGIMHLSEKERILDSGDMVILSPGTEYRVVLEPEQKIIVVNFDLNNQNSDFPDKVLFEKSNKFDETKIIDRTTVAGFIPDCGYSVKKTHKTMYKLCTKISSVYTDALINKEIKSVILTGTIMEILGEFFRNDESIDEKTKEIYDYICRNFQESISLDDLSLRFNYHKTYINRLLKKYYNMSFKQILIDLRLNHSLIMLEESDMTMSEIASCLGFYDCKHFQHAFKNKYGINPSEYRK